MTGAATGAVFANGGADPPLCVQTTIDNWQDAHRLVGERWMEGWIFRGHEDATWLLTTSFDRNTWNRGTALPRSPYFGREKQALIEFKRRVHHYVPEPPRDADELEWLALIQHHGGPTRLLDFTHSFYVAAFFALERSKGEAAVWAIKRDELNTNAAAQYRAKVEPALPDEFDWAQRGLERFNQAVHQGIDVPLAVSLEPSRMNLRLAAQQGLFVVPLAIHEPFLTNLAGSFGRDASALAPRLELRFPDDGWPADVPIIKMILPPSIHEHALRDLRRMNVTTVTMFPGLDGLARSLSYYLQ